jgi:hypothetical protein
LKFFLLDMLMLFINFVLQMIAACFCTSRRQRRKTADITGEKHFETNFHVKDRCAAPSSVTTDDDAKSTDASGSCEGSEAESADVAADSDSSLEQSDRDPECVMPHSATDSEACSIGAQPDKCGKLRRRKLRDLRGLRLPRRLRTNRPTATSAPPCAPQQQIKAVTSALDAWLTCKSDQTQLEDCWSQSEEEGIQNQKLDGLKTAMSMLAPHEVALMKAMLDVKIATCPGDVA